MVSDDTPPFEIALELPELLKEPVVLPNGDVVDVGDKVEHQKFGIGSVYRIATYHDHLGILLCVEFPDNLHKMLCLDVVKKLEPRFRPVKRWCCAPRLYLKLPIERDK